MLFRDNDTYGIYLSPISNNVLVSDRKHFKSIYHYYLYHKFAASSNELLMCILNTRNRRRILELTYSKRYTIVDRWDEKKKIQCDERCVQVNV